MFESNYIKQWIITSRFYFILSTSKRTLAFMEWCMSYNDGCLDQFSCNSNEYLDYEKGNSLVNNQYVATFLQKDSHYSTHFKPSVPIFLYLPKFIKCWIYREKLYAIISTFFNSSSERYFSNGACSCSTWILLTIMIFIL